MQRAHDVIMQMCYWAFNLGVVRVDIKKHSKDNEQSIVKMKKPVRCDGLHADRGVFRLSVSVLSA